MARRACLLKLLAHRGANHFHIARMVKALPNVRVKGVLNLLAARVERALIGLLGQADQHLVVAGHIVVDDGGILDAGCRGSLANLPEVGSLGKLDLHLRAAAEVHAQRHRAAHRRRGAPSASPSR